MARKLLLISDYWRGLIKLYLYVSFHSHPSTFFIVQLIKTSYLSALPTYSPSHLGCCFAWHTRLIRPPPPLLKKPVFSKLQRGQFCTYQSIHISNYVYVMLISEHQVCLVNNLFTATSDTNNWGKWCMPDRTGSTVVVRKLPVNVLAHIVVMNAHQCDCMCVEYKCVYLCVSPSITAGLVVWGTKGTSSFKHLEENKSAVQIKTHCEQIRTLWFLTL